jgi:phosphomannomutase
MSKLINTIQEIPKEKKVFVFDLDGTLVESKANIDTEMGSLLAGLLAKGKVAIIGGASFEQMVSQLPDNISKDNDLLLLPLDGGSFYLYRDSSWQKIYSQSLTDEEKKKIMDAFGRAFRDIGYVQPVNLYGEIIEDRIGQVTFSALGQQAPVEEKKKWAVEKNGERLKIFSKLKNYLLDLEVKLAGLTSIDVTRKGIDKKFGIEQIIKNLGVTAEDVIFFGDALGPDGNDYPALESGVLCYKVSSIQDTKDAIKHLLN